jgi:hypothetical protein
MRFRQARRWKWYHHRCLFHPINKILREQKIGTYTTEVPIFIISFRKKKPFYYLVSEVSWS